MCTSEIARLRERLAMLERQLEMLDEIAATYEEISRLACELDETTEKHKTKKVMSS